MSNFHPLEIVGRGSETQVQVGENLPKPQYVKPVHDQCWPIVYDIGPTLILHWFCASCLQYVQCLFSMYSPGGAYP